MWEAGCRNNVSFACRLLPATCLLLYQIYAGHPFPTHEAVETGLHPLKNK